MVDGSLHINVSCHVTSVKHSMSQQQFITRHFIEIESRVAMCQNGRNSGWLIIGFLSGYSMEEVIQKGEWPGSEKQCT